MRHNSSSRRRCRRRRGIEALTPPALTLAAQATRHGTGCGAADAVEAMRRLLGRLMRDSTQAQWWQAVATGKRGAGERRARGAATTGAGAARAAPAAAAGGALTERSGTSALADRCAEASPEITRTRCKDDTVAEATNGLEPRSPTRARHALPNAAKPRRSAAWAAAAAARTSYMPLDDAQRAGANFNKVVGRRWRASAVSRRASGPSFRCAKAALARRA